ncbi:hypothetical protein ACGYQ5_14445 [Burkholderia pseudomallei]
MSTNEDQPKPEDDEVWGPADLGRFLGYKTETIRSYSTQHPDRLPPRIKGLKRPRWLRSVAMKWARETSITLPTDVKPETSILAARKPRVGRPRKMPAR